MRMCPLIPCLLAPALMAQAPADPAEARTASVRASQDGVTPIFFWVRPKEHLYQGGWELDPRLGWIIASGEIRYAVFDDGEQVAWAARLGWSPGPHWVLLSPKGEPLLSAEDQPRVGAWLDAMRATGWTPYHERCAEFLRVHPDQGDAWGEALREATRYASHRAVVEKRLNPATPKDDPGLNAEDIDARPTPPDQDQAQWGPAKEALDGLMKVEGWTDQRNLPVDVTALRVGGVKNSQIMRDPLRRLQKGVEAALRLHPSRDRLWEVWFWASEIWDAESADPQALLEGLDPMPRQPWPPLASSAALGEAFTRKKDWQGLEAFAGRAYARCMDPGISRYQGPGFGVEVAVNWTFWRLLALGKQGRGPEALALLKEARAAIGHRWPWYASNALGPSLSYYLGKDDPVVQALLAGEKEKAPSDPPKLTPLPPLRLALLGHPAWERAWGRLASLSAFDAWEPGAELVWPTLKSDETQRLRARMGWGAEPRWALLRGEDLLASGTSLPSPTFLADRMRVEGLPYLEQLGAFIRTHPDDLEAREARVAALRARMPNERLEATLLEDARATLVPFEGDGAGSAWTPRKDLWAPVARAVLPDLEARLQRWPEDKALWWAWMDWSAVSEPHRSPTRLMESLAIWKSRYNAGAGPLPDEILALVSTRLEREGRWQDLQDWCQAFWEGGVQDDLARLSESTPNLNPRDRARRGEKRAVYLRFLLSPDYRAFEHLGRAERLQAFLQDLKDMDPSLADLVTASSTPPRPGK